MFDVDAIDPPTEISVQHRMGAAPTLLVIVAVAATVGFLASGSEATFTAFDQGGRDLARLLRGMAVIKAMTAIGLVAAIHWRLAAPIGRRRFVAYALASAAMAMGPGLIWNMAYLKLGALLLHGGLVMSAFLLWRDREMVRRLESEITRRLSRPHA